MQQFDQRIVLSALAELGGDIQGNLKDPQALGKVQMTRFLLAHLLGRQDGTDEHTTIGEEVAALKQAEADEQKILSAKPEGATFGTAVTADALTAYLREKLGDPEISITSLRASLGGFSKQTYILELSGAERFGNQLVMRRDQVGGPVESRTADEYPVIRLMHERTVPVPEPLWADHQSPFGGTCMFMRMVPGKTAYDVTGTQIGGDGKDAAFALARVLAKIHATPLASLQLPAEVAGLSLGEHVRLMVKFYEEQWFRRRLENSPTIEAAFKWLYANVPDQAAPALVHGDASLRNLMMDDGRESALLDWELWHVGDYNEDLAYCRTDVEQFIAWEDFVGEYRKHGGGAFDSLSGDYYAIFGALRNSVFTAACLHSFVNAPVPEPKLAYGALSMGRRLICDMAERLEKQL